MHTLGISAHEGLIFEGENTYCRCVSPSPTVVSAHVLQNDPDLGSIPEKVDLYTAGLVFREDAFDPVTRIRRGRFYFRMPNSGQPQHCILQPHPGISVELASHHPLTTGKDLFLFSQWPASRELARGVTPSIVAFGPRDAHTLWRVVDLERLVTGEDLVTLKARGSMGVLPEVDLDAVPSGARANVNQLLDALVHTANSDLPGSIVESARKATQYCLGAWLAEKRGDSNLVTKDIGDLLGKIPDEAQVIKNLAHTISRFHVREKPNEVVRLGLRPVVEGDAEYVLASVGLLMRELGWAR